eukprot:349961-Chlamydomonas_euryale.AAC.1
MNVLRGGMRSLSGHHSVLAASPKRSLPILLGIRAGVSVAGARRCAVKVGRKNRAMTSSGRILAAVGGAHGMERRRSRLGTGRNAVSPAAPTKTARPPFNHERPVAANQLALRTAPVESPQHAASRTCYAACQARF